MEIWENRWTATSQSYEKASATVWKNNDLKKVLEKEASRDIIRSIDRMASFTW